MSGNRVARVVKIALIGTVAIAVFGFATMSLWNWLMPALFGLRPIGFWQALGLLVLSKILFGGFHRHEGRDMHWRRRMLERWGQMTPEERERFRSDIRRGCSFAEPPQETT
ncbi:MAG: hypothetical protein WBL65_10320 [Bryobacteraceae bacterium]